MADSDRSFDRTVQIPAPRDVVWEALATAAGLEAWFCPKAEFENRLGGEVVWEWDGHFRWPQTLAALEDGRHLRTTYPSAVDDGAGGKRPLFIDWKLEGEGGTTTLRIVHSGFGAESGFDEEYDGISRGWNIELKVLEHYLRHHAGKARQLVWGRKQLSMPATDVWRELTGPRGLGCGSDVDTRSVGDAFDFTTAAGDRLCGNVLHAQTREVSGDVHSHDHALFRFWVQEWQGATHVWVWLAAYGAAASEVPGLQHRWDRMLEDLFDSNEAAAGAEGSV